MEDKPDEEFDKATEEALRALARLIARAAIQDKGLASGEGVNHSSDNENGTAAKSS